MYNRTLAYEVCKTHVDDTSTKMYTNDVENLPAFLELYQPSRTTGTIFLYICIYILGIRIRSEGLAQVMTKRNASEYIIGSIQR